MAKPPKELEQLPPVVDAPHAPVIYFDFASNWSAMEGVVAVTLTFRRQLAASEGVETDIVTTAHLRCSIPAALGLRDTLDKAILSVTPPTGRQVN